MQIISVQVDMLQWHKGLDYVLAVTNSEVCTTLATSYTIGVVRVRQTGDRRTNVSLLDSIVGMVRYPKRVWQAKNFRAQARKYSSALPSLISMLHLCIQTNQFDLSIL